jgi:hypothetical protein
MIVDAGCCRDPTMTTNVPGLERLSREVTESQRALELRRYALLSSLLQAILTVGTDFLLLRQVVEVISMRR